MIAKESQGDGQLRFAHLSDIHFSHYHDDGRYDLDSDLRDQVERDLVRMKERLGEFSGVLVTGDVAFSGQRDEYAKATEWLARVCEILELEPHQVWVVPGNHDVDRQIFRTTELLPMLHDRLRNSAPDQLGAELRTLLTEDQNAGELLLAPLAAYNEFAAIYQCATTPSDPVWNYDLRLNDGSQLILWGMNSALTSDKHDEQGNLVLGAMQVNIPERDDRCYLTLCHHPPSWLRDHDQIEEALSARAHVQLFGHRHVPTLQTINNRLRLSAGAVHPDRSEGDWTPHYNILELVVDWPDADTRQLVVTVYPREWDRPSRRFKPRVDADGQPWQQERMPLTAWRSVLEEVEGMPMQNAHEASSDSVDDQRQIPLDPLRHVTYLLLTLPHHRQHQILSEMGLLAEDEAISELMAIRKALERAIAEGVLEQLRDKLRGLHGLTDEDANDEAARREG